MRFTKEIWDNCVWLDDGTILYKNHKLKVRKCLGCGQICLVFHSNKGYCSHSCWLRGNTFRKGKTISDEHKLAISRTHVGNKYTLGRKVPKEEIQRRTATFVYTEERREQQRKRMFGNTHSKGKCSGDKHHNWKGGISTEPYCCVWTTEYKQEILERDDYTCSNPQCTKKPNQQLCVHHIDHNKKNCHPKNLIVVCRSCHARTNKNSTTWKALYQLILNKKFAYQYLEGETTRCE